MDITKMSEQELKALAYDLTVQMNIAQQNLQTVQTKLAELAEEDKLKKEENGTKENKGTK